jgi:fatty-acyl-CoA synthase
VTRNPYDIDLDRNPANFQPLTPLSFLERAATVFPDSTAIIHGKLRRSYAEFYTRARRLASALAQRGIARGDTVSAVLPNTPAMLECHYGVPMTGGVLNTINTRLDAAVVAFQLDHAEAKVVITDREFSKLTKEALALAKVKPLVIDYDDPELTGAGERIGEIEYEELVASGDPGFAWKMPDDEWDAITLNYTSGTTGDPKGVVYHHRGAYLLAIGNVLTGSMASTASISGRCRCSTVTAGAFPGPSRWWRARMCACGRCARQRCTMPSPPTRSRISAARRS